VRVALDLSQAERVYNDNRGVLSRVEQSGRQLQNAEVWQRAFGSAYSAREAWRDYSHIDTLRSRVSPFGPVICTIIHHGCMLLREPQEW